MKRFCSIFVFFTVIALFCAATARPASFEVSAPGKNARIQLGKNYRIRWQAQGISGYLKIILYNNMTRLGVIKDMVSISGGQYLWKAGKYANTWTGMPKGRYRIKLESMAGGHVAEGFSEFFFLSPSINILSPAKGNAWPTGEKKKITGIVLGYSGALNLELWEGKRFKGRIAQGLNVNNHRFTFQWQVPRLLNGQIANLQGNYHIKAVAVQGGLADLSESFTIIMGPSPVKQKLNPKTLQKPDYKEQIKRR